MELLDLPEEILTEITAHLPPVDICKFSETCKLVKKITEEPSMWRLVCARHEFLLETEPSSGWKTHFIDCFGFSADPERIHSNLELDPLDNKKVSGGDGAHKAFQSRQPIHPTGTTSFEVHLTLPPEDRTLDLKSVAWFGVGVANHQHSLAEGWHKHNSGGGLYSYHNFLFACDRCVGSFSSVIPAGDALVRVQLNRDTGVMRVWVNGVSATTDEIQDDHWIGKGEGSDVLYPTVIMIKPGGTATLVRRWRE